MLLQTALSSVRARLLLLVLVLMAPAFSLALYRGWEARQTATEETREGVLRLAQRLASEQEQLVEQAQQLLTALAQLPDLQRGDSAACRPVFENLLRDNAF